MKKTVALLMTVLTLVFVLASCGEPYVGKYQFQEIDSLGEGAEFSLTLKSKTFKIEVANGNQEMIISGSCKVDEKNNVTLLTEKRIMIDEKGNKKAEKVEDADDWVMIYEDDKLLTQEGITAFTKEK